MKYKFNVGQIVYLKKDAEERPENREEHEVLAIRLSLDGIQYTITAKQLDIAKRRLKNGHMNVAEEEILEVKK